MNKMKESIKEEEVKGYESNLTPEDQEALMKLQRRIEKKEIVIQETDKSSKYAVMTEETLIKMGEKHTRNDKEISMDEAVKVAANLDLHTDTYKNFCQSL